MNLLIVQAEFDIYLVACTSKDILVTVVPREHYTTFLLQGLHKLHIIIEWIWIWMTCELIEC